MKKDKTILEYCSVCDEELEMPIVQKDPNNPHLVWVRCPKCNETKPVDVLQVVDDIHEAKVEDSEEPEGEEYLDDERLEGDVEFESEKIPPVAPEKKPTKKKAAKPKGKKDKKEVQPEVEYKIQQDKAKEYSPAEVFKPGETIFHKHWKQYGVVLRMRRSGGGRDLIEVRFEKNQIKKLLVNLKQQSA